VLAGGGVRKGPFPPRPPSSRQTQITGDATVGRLLTYT
jgi:hypothetical protein